MARNDLITKDFALYTVHYFASMLTWSKQDILGEIDRTIKEATPIDAVRVVRCKDCKWYQGCECRKTDGLMDVKPNDFCSYGERKDNV